jgi:hypothetical protein
MDTSIAAVAIVAALAVLGIVVVMVAVTIPLQLQQLEAAPGCEKGLPQSAFAFNASQGRCFRP